MWTLANINKIWILFLNGGIVLASKKWDLHDGTGKFIVSGVKMKDYASKELGAPEVVERIRTFTPEQNDMISSYLRKIGVEVEVPKPVIEASVVKPVERKPLQKPVVTKQEPTAEEIAFRDAQEAEHRARQEREEDDRIHRDLVKKVAAALDCETVELRNMMTVRGNDDAGRDCLAIVKNLDIVPYVDREKGQGIGTRSRNKWFAEKLKRLVAEAAFAEKRMLEDAHPDNTEEREFYA